MHKKFKENANKLTLSQCKTLPFELSALSFSILKVLEENGNTPSTCLLLFPLPIELPKIYKNNNKAKSVSVI